MSGPTWNSSPVSIFFEGRKRLQRHLTKYSRNLGKDQEHIFSKTPRVQYIMMPHPSLVKKTLREIEYNIILIFQLEALRQHQQSASANRRTSPLLTVHSIEEDGDCVDGTGATAR